MGSTYAKVFPEPVSARTMRSSCLKALGMTYNYTFRGLLYLSAFTLLTKTTLSSVSVQLIGLYFGER